MTEEQIERCVEREIDKLDARFMRSDMSQAEYEGNYRLIDRWARYQYSVALDQSGVWTEVQHQNDIQSKQY